MNQSKEEFPQINEAPSSNLLGELILDSEVIAWDHDETLVIHDPRFQRWLGLHALYVDHGGDPSQLNRYALNYENELSNEASENEEYLQVVRDVSAKTTGDPFAFEQTAHVFATVTNDGAVLSTHLRSLPRYRSAESDKGFWTTRSAIINQGGVPLDCGKSLGCGVQEFSDYMGLLGKRQALISNSRETVVRPILDELLDKGCATFDVTLALAGSGLARKPNRESMDHLHEMMDTDKIIYIGNSVEDIKFGQNSKVSTIILGEPMPKYPSANYASSAAQLLDIVHSCARTN